LVKRKNVDSILKAISLLPVNLQEAYKFVVMGDGPEKQGLIDLSKKLNLTNVEFLGEIYGIRKIEWLLRAKLFVMCPDQYIKDIESGIEGFGISYLEAQAAGLPVIGSNQGGIPDAVGDGGLLVQNPTDPQEIASCIRQLLMDDKFYQHYQDNAKSRIKDFDRRKIFGQFEELYQRALNHV